MAHLSSRYVPNIYDEFKDLSGSEPRELARFYEHNQSLIQNLETGKFFDLQVSYLTALFELGSHQKILEIIDEPIEVSIMHNIKEHNGKDVFKKLLFMKGDALYHIMEYPKAKYIFLELLKMEGNNLFYKDALAKTMRKMVPRFVKNSRALCILFFILSAIIIAIEMLAVKHFFSDFAVAVEWLRNILFGLGWFTLLGSELAHYFKVQHEVNKISVK